MTVEETVERTIFEMLRLAVVAAGLLPDATLFTTIPAYEAAKAALALTLPGKVVTEVYGVGMPYARNEIVPNRIYIDPNSRERGTLAGFSSTYYEKQVDTTFNQYEYPDFTEDLSYSIRVITGSVDNKRRLAALVTNTLGLRRYHPSIKDDSTLTGERFLVERTGVIEVGDVKFFEEMFIYSVSDLWLQDFKLLRTNIPELKSVQPAIAVQPKANNLPTSTIDLSF